MLTRTQTFSNLGPEPSFYGAENMVDESSRAGPSILRDDSSYQSAGVSQPTSGTEPVTPPHFSNSQPVAGRFYHTYYVKRENGLPPMKHHVSYKRAANGEPAKPGFKPINFNEIQFGKRSPSPPRRTPSPLFPEPSCNLRPAFVPQGVYDEPGGPIIARDYAYADRNPIRPETPPDQKKEKKMKKKVEPEDALKLLQNNKYFNPTGRPFPLLDKHGTILNGHEVYADDMQDSNEPHPYDLMTEEQKANLVPTPIVSPNGTLHHFDDPNYEELRAYASQPQPLDLRQTNLGPMLERIADQLNRQNEDEDDSRSPTPSPTPTPSRTPPPRPINSCLLPSLFGEDSSLTSLGSSSASLDSSASSGPDALTHEMSTVNLAAIEEDDDPPHRYQLRQRQGTPQTPMQISRPNSASRRSRHSTPSLSPQTRVKENVGDETRAATPPDHPHHPRPASSRSRVPPPLKRMREEESSSASLHGSPAVAAIVAPAHVEASNAAAAETTQRMTRSRARKARRLDGNNTE